MFLFISFARNELIKFTTSSRELRCISDAYTAYPIQCAYSFVVIWFVDLSDMFTNNIQDPLTGMGTIIFISLYRMQSPTGKQNVSCFDTILDHGTMSIRLSFYHRLIYYS